jgi:hypothetical protein
VDIIRVHTHHYHRLNLNSLLLPTFHLSVFVKVHTMNPKWNSRVCPSACTIFKINECISIKCRPITVVRRVPHKHLLSKCNSIAIWSVRAYKPTVHKDQLNIAKFLKIYLR